MKKKQMIAGIIGSILVVQAVDAAIFDFSYQFTAAGTLSGQLEGVLQSDGNTVVVTSIIDYATFNATTLPSLPFVADFDTTLNDAKVTIDGSFMDLVACTTSTCSGVSFGFLYPSATLAAIRPDLSQGSIAEPYYASSWSLSPAGVPEPATLALFGLGLAGIPFVRRRRTPA